MMGGLPLAAPPGVPGGPTFASLAGPGPQQAGGPDPMAAPGQGQIGGAATRMAMEIDQALKLLARLVPGMAPWLVEVSGQLKMQLGQALAGGGVSTDAGVEGPPLPDGSSRLTP